MIQNLMLTAGVNAGVSFAVVALLKTMGFNLPDKIITLLGTLFLVNLAAFVVFLYMYIWLG